MPHCPQGLFLRGRVVAPLLAAILSAFTPRAGLQAGGARDTPLHRGLAGDPRLLLRQLVPAGPVGYLKVGTLAGLAAGLSIDKRPVQEGVQVIVGSSVRGDHGDFLDRFKVLGDRGVAPAIAGGFYLAGRLAGSPREQETGLLLAESFLASGALAGLGQFILAEDRPRDGGALRFFRSGGHGVSGHAAVAASLSVPLAHQYFRLDPGDSRGMKFAKGAGQLVVYTLPFLTGLSRIRTDSHYLWNVLLGLAAGYRAGAAVVTIHEDEGFRAGAMDAGPLEASTEAIAIVRLRYDGGGDWYNDPSIIPNLCRALNERMTIRAREQEVVCSAGDAQLFDYPFVFLTGHGNIRFTEEEVERLRTYLTSGGFLYADDDYGMDAAFRREIARIFPDKELVELPLSFPLYHYPYDFPQGLPKIHKHNGKPPRGYGIFQEGRLVVYYTYETNISDGWNDPGVYDDPPEVREEAIRMGINIVTYALLH